MALTRRPAWLGIISLFSLLWFPNLLLVLLWAALLLFILLDFLLTPSAKKLRITRELGEQVRLGETLDGRLLVTNPYRRTIKVVLRDAFNPSAGLAANQRFKLRLPGRERRAAEETFVPTRRGRHYSRGVWVEVFGPLGFVSKTARLEAPGEFNALHPFAARKYLPSRLRRLQEIEGGSVVLTRGQGSEFDSLRDFVDGDDVRSIDWRATARRKELVVRTWRPERDRQVLIVLDTSRTSAIRIGEGTRLDYAIDAALLLGALASRAGDRVDLLCIDRVPHARLAGEAPNNLLPAMIDTTSALFPALVETDHKRLVKEVVSCAKKGSLVVLLSSLDEGSLENGLLPVASQLTADYNLLVASVSDPLLPEMQEKHGNVREVYEAASASQTLVQQHRAAEMLHRSGALVVDAPSDSLAPKLSDTYLALKAAGKL
ncbi:DUF58 domain-containing protein [Dermabacteraceae bacterium P9123]